MKVASILSAVIDHEVLDVTRIALVAPDDPVVRAIGSVISAKGISDVRLKSNLVNGIYIEDALVYRTAARAAAASRCLGRPTAHDIHCGGSVPRLSGSAAAGEIAERRGVGAGGASRTAPRAQVSTCDAC
jgi:hypothetical protein